MRRPWLILCVPVLLLTGCGNLITTDVIGATGITVDDQGNPVALIEVCTGTIDHLDVAGTREGLADDEPNPSFGEWAAADPQQGPIEVNLITGTPGWTGPKLVLESGHGYIVEGNSSTADVVASQTVFTVGSLAKLKPGQVIVRDGEVVTREAFKEDACKDAG